MPVYLMGVDMGRDQVELLQLHMEQMLDKLPKTFREKLECDIVAFIGLSRSRPSCRGALLQAGALVNGASIVHETHVPTTFTYYQVEDHSLILAESTPAETFVDNVDRLGFDNWAEHEALYPNGKNVTELPYPRAKSHRQVPVSLRVKLGGVPRQLALWRIVLRTRDPGKLLETRKGGTSMPPFLRDQALFSALVRRCLLISLSTSIPAAFLERCWLGKLDLKLGSHT